MKEVKRLIEDRVVQSLKVFPVVYISGPRQSGKTTLVRRIASSRHQASYITFDDLQMRSAAKKDPYAFLSRFKERVVFDEVQMVPEIFRPLKMIVDNSRRMSHGGRGKFLLTGSADIMALPKLSDALVGRIALHTLLPFSTKELMKRNNRFDFISNIFSNQWAFEKLTKEKDNALQVIVKASFPELLSLKDPELRFEWCNSYLNTILQSDIRFLMEIEKIASLPNMLHLLASRTGGLLNDVFLSRNTGLNHVTSKKYRVLMENLFLTLSIPAWSTNLKKRLVKASKVYLNDINLLSYLLNVDLKDVALKNQILFGQFIENFVAIELVKQLTFSKTRARLYHYRTSVGQEVDFFLEGPRGKIVAIEVKSASQVTTKDFRHLEAVKNDFKSQFQRGLVLYLGKDIVSFGKKFYAVPLKVLWGH